MTKKHSGRIENWQVYHYGNGNSCVVGRLHARDDEDRYAQGFHEGYIGPVRTSLIVKISATMVETMNSIYDLGEPAHET